MNRYDEDRVIALLREAVPPVPDAAPDRVTAVKDRAGRQRATLWTQTLGAVASVLLVVGVAAAVSGPDAPRRISPTDEPLKALALALTKQTSVKFDATMEPVRDPKPVPEAGLTVEQVRELMTGRVSGAATRDGDFRIAGDASFLQAWALGYDSESPGPTGDSLRYDVDFRLVDGVAYRTPGPGEEIPAGKKWISDRNSEVQDVDDLRRALNLLGTFAENVHYVREYEIASEPVAEYELTVPAKVTSSVPVKVRFALDAADRLRRVTSQFSFTRLTMGGGVSEESFSSSVTFGSGSGQSGWTEYPQGDQHEDQQPDPPRNADPLDVRVQIDLYGYGENAGIVAPPAREVVTEDSLYTAPTYDHDVLSACVEKAGTDREKAQDCFRSSTSSSMAPVATPSPECAKQPDGSTICTFGDGSGGYGFGSGVPSTQPSPPPGSGRSVPSRPRPAATLSPAA